MGKTQKSKGTGGKSIKAQLSGMIIAIMAIPLVVVIIVSTLLSRNQSIEDIDSANVLLAESIEAEVASVLDQNMQALQAFASAPSTQVFITDHNGQTDSGSNLEDSLMKQMKTIDEALADGNSTIITGNTGMQLMRTEGDCVDISDREYYKKAMSGTLYVSDAQISKSTGSMIATFAVPVYSEDGSQVVGIVQRNYNLNVFHDILNKRIIEDKHEIVIVDRTGAVVAHSSHEVDPNNPESQASNPFYTDSRGDKQEGAYTADFQGEKWLVSWVKEPKTGWVVASCRVEGVAMSHVNNMLMIMLAIGVVAFIIAIIVSLMFANRISNPIKSVADSVKELTAGNLMTSFDSRAASRNDEIGQIASNSIALAEKLQDVIGRSKEMAGGLKHSGEELSESSSQASMASSQVTEAVEAVSMGAVSQAESVQTAVDEMNTIETGVNAIAESAGELLGASKNMETNCGETMESLKTLISQSEKVSFSVEQIGDTIARTNEGANEISQFTEAINSIATQTNLLSLNASIEAARAGEAGKGFAVVAGEISNLADQSKESADKINEIVTRLMHDAASSVDVMNILRDNFKEQGLQLDATRERMDNMAESITAVAHSTDNINGKVNDLRVAKDHLGDIIEDLSAISQENAASTQQTNASMEELNATFNIISESAGSLEKSAVELDEMIGFFKLDANQ